MLLISAGEEGRRVGQHRAVIDAAVEAGISLLAYRTGPEALPDLVFSSIAARSDKHPVHPEPQQWDDLSERLGAIMLAFGSESDTPGTVTMPRLRSARDNRRLTDIGG